MVTPYLQEEWQREQEIVTLDEHGVVKAVGKYILKYTLGKGSMGKVKLGVHALTGERLAIKIVPRASRSRTLTNKEVAREIRAVREGHLMMLLHHPHIVHLRDMVAGRHFYYFLMECVSGGQLLHYIVKRERLSEKHSRHFTRQIVSALDYMHRNSVVHRDLKIENILVDETGRNIKIIDFGLSNLFCPERQLTTFCGSLYFAAPELLSGRPYHGPEIDVWSLGVVLYVMVTGSVPFDDKSLPGLHEKIKRAQVAYPAHMSTSCHHLLSHIFIADPHQRITLADIVMHTWMNEGRASYVNNYMPLRKPLSLPLDNAVLQRMTFGFNLGSVDDIKKKMHVILQSSVYQVSAAHVWEMQRRAIQAREQQRQQKHRKKHGFDELHQDEATILTLGDRKDDTPLPPSTTTTSTMSKLAWMRRPATSHHHHHAQNHHQTSNNNNKHMIWGTYHDPQTVPAAYHPLLSIYYLTMERLERIEKAQLRDNGQDMPDTITTPRETRQSLDNYRKHRHRHSLATSSRSLPVTTTMETHANMHASTSSHHPPSMSAAHHHHHHHRHTRSYQFGASLSMSSSMTATAAREGMPPLPGPQANERASFQHHQHEPGHRYQPSASSHATSGSSAFTTSSPFQHNTTNAARGPKRRKSLLAKLGTMFHKKRAQPTLSSSTSANNDSPPYPAATIRHHPDDDASSFFAETVSSGTKTPKTSIDINKPGFYDAPANATATFTSPPPLLQVEKLATTSPNATTSARSRLRSPTWLAKRFSAWRQPPSARTH